MGKGQSNKRSKEEDEEKISKKIVSPEQIPKTMGFLMNLGQRHFLSSCIFTVVSLGCIDAIGDGKLTAAEVISRLPEENKGVSVELLERLLRVITQDEILIEGVNDKGKATFSLTDAGALLQTGAPQPSFKSMIYSWNSPAFNRALSCIPELVSLNSHDPTDTAFSLYHKKSIFQHYADDEMEGKMFNEFMTLFSIPEKVHVVKFFKEELGQDIPHLKTVKVVDVGAGYGHVMEAVVQQCPELLQEKPVVFDLANVIDEVKEKNENLEYVKGDFFDADTIPEADVYFMKHIMHDWSDGECIKILKNLAIKIKAEGRVVVYETVLPGPGEEGDPLVKKNKFYLDVVMMILCSGKERTKKQWEKLGQDSGFSLLRIAEPYEPGQFGRLLVFRKQ